MYEDDEETSAAPLPRSPLAAASEPLRAQPQGEGVYADPYGGLSREELMAEAQRFIDPKARHRAFAAGIMKPKATGHFSEAYGNALAGYNAAADKDAELLTKYMPIVQRAAQARAQAKLQAQQAARATLDTTMASLLTQPQFSPQLAQQAIGALVQQGRVPRDMAEAYRDSLPQDPEALRAFVTQQAISRVDPYRAVAQPKTEVYSEGQVGFEVDPVTRERREVGSGRSKPTSLSKALGEMMNLPAGDPRRAVYSDMIRKMTTHPPQATTIIQPDKKITDVLASGMGEQVLGARLKAEAAVESLQNANALSEVLKSPVFAGPTGEWQATLARVVGSDQRKLEATTLAARMMAQSELDAAAQMRGQGAMSDAERALVKRVALGDPKLTVGEVRAAIKAAEAQARRRIASYNRSAGILLKMPAIAQAGMAPLLAPIEDPFNAPSIVSDNAGPAATHRLVNGQLVPVAKP
jgi:hypothetical protein